MAAACSNPPAAPAAPQALPVASGPVVAMGGGSASGLSIQTSPAPWRIESSPVLADCFGGSHAAFCFAAESLRQLASAAAAAPGAPTNLTSSSSGGNVTLAWSAPGSGDPVTAYVIEAGSSPGLANLANFSTGNAATSFSASGVGAGTYYVRVRAQNAAGVGPSSNESTLVVGASGCSVAPGAPAGLASAVSGSTVTLSWSAPAGGCATSYILQAGSASGASNLANANVGNVTSYTATGVGPGTYYVRVRAQNAIGQSGASNETVLTVGTALVITGWGAQLQVQSVVVGSGPGCCYYITSGTITMTTNIGVTGLLRGEFQSSPKIGAQQRIIGLQTRFQFFPFVISPGCPDLHGTKALNLYDDERGGAFLGSIQAELHGTGCAFSP